MEKLVYALARLASKMDADLLITIPAECLKKPSIAEEMNEIEEEPQKPNWMTPIASYLHDQILPTDKDKVQRLKFKVAQYIMYDGVLYHRGLTTPYLDA